MNLKNLFSPNAWHAAWKELTHWRSPFRIVRWYVLRVLHPFAFLQRRKLAWKPSADQQEQAERLATVLRDGSDIAKPDLDPELLSQVCTELRTRGENVEIDPNGPTKGKNFWKHLLTPEDLTSDSPFVQLALQPGVLNMVSAYLGEVPYLAYIHVTVSHETDNEGWKGSQLWHEDYDDRRMLKLFIYCTDVNGPDDGAFTFIPSHLSKTVPNSFYPGRISDEKMEKYVNDDAITRLTGPAESAFYIDTRNCYHLGSRIAPGHRRVAYMASFVSFAALQKFKNDIVVNHELNEVERLVLRK